MKKIVAFLALGFLLANSIHAQADKSKRPSPPAKVSEKITSGATITIDYSQPSLKERVIGTSVEPMKGQVWRMGANEATIFQTDKDVMVQNQKLPAGKYALFGLWTDDGYTLIFNSNFKQWGTQYEQNKDKDVLKVKADVKTTTKSQEKLTYTIEPSGLVHLWWGNMNISFKVH